VTTPPPDAPVTVFSPLELAKLLVHVSEEFKHDPAVMLLATAAAFLYLCDMADADDTRRAEIMHSASQLVEAWRDRVLANMARTMRDEN
jgi:hypothetical protein